MTTPKYNDGFFHGVEIDPGYYPAGRVPGCLPRKYPVGTVCSKLEDAMKVIPVDQWASLINKVPSIKNYINVILDQDGVGCHDEKTEVLTVTGWQSWATYDKAPLGTINPLTHNLEFQLPTDVYRYDYDGPLHYREHRSMSYAVTPNHRMYLRRWNESLRRLENRYTIRNAENVGWYAGLLAAPAGYVGLELPAIKVGETTYNGDDFIALVSLVLSDGWAGGQESTMTRVSFCCFRDNRYEMVSSLARSIGFKEEESRKGVWVTSNAPLAQWMRDNLFTGNDYHSHEKRVPQFIKHVCQRQVELFLQYYGDQHVADGRRAFYTSSKQMADDLQELLLRIGKRAGISAGKIRSAVMKDGRVVTGKHIPYTITEWQGDNLSLEGKKTGVDHYKGPVFCATVPNSLLVTRRDGQVLISGNSCATESCAGSVMAASARRGQKFELLNPWYIYHTTSGGTDSGSNIDENLAFARDKGVAPESVWPRSKGWRATPSAEANAAAKKNRILEFYDVTTKAEFGTALLLGWSVVWGYSGHSILGVELLSETQLKYANSWGDWTDCGDTGYGKASFSSVVWGYGAFAVRTTTDASPEDPLAFIHDVVLPRHAEEQERLLCCDARPLEIEAYPQNAA